MKNTHLLSFVAISIGLFSCAPVPTPNDNPASADGVVAAVDSSVPVAVPHPERKQNLVVSPYKPYNVIDVKGFKSGDIVGDPSTAAVNPKTGKPDSRTAKHFRIP